MEGEIENHAIWSSLRQLSELKGRDAFTDMAADPQVQWLSQHVFQLATLVESRLMHAPKVLLSIHALNQIQSGIASAVNEINNFVSNRNIGHLNNAVSHIDNNVHPFLPQIPIVFPEPTGEAIGKITDDYRNQTQAVLKSLFEQQSRMQSEVTALGANKQELSQQIKELMDLVAIQKAEAAVTVQSLQTKYSAKEQEIQAAFEKVQSANAISFNKIMVNQNEVFDTQVENSRVVANQLVQDLESEKAKAKKIVGIIGNIGITGNYQEVARLEAKQADTWRWATVVAFVFSAVMGAIALILANDVDLRLTVARMLFALLVMGITVYTGRESARHRTNADAAKRVELELASLGPFIESLPVERQSELRARLTDQYFGKEVRSHEVRPLVEISQILDLLKVAISKLGKN